MAGDIRVIEVLAALERFAPAVNAMESDNIGLICGDDSMAVSGVLVALEFDHAVLSEALAIDANVILVHHAPIHRAVHALTTRDPETDALIHAIKHNIAIVAAHTNFDVAIGGTSDILAQLLLLKNIERADAYTRVGELPTPLTLKDFATQVKNALNTAVRAYGVPNRMIARVAVCAGRGEDCAEIAQADAFVTGEIKYHYALTLSRRGLNVIEAGHAETERIAMTSLAMGLQNALNEVQCPVRITVSKQSAGCFTV